MSKPNPLGLLVNYGDSDEESDDGKGSKVSRTPDGFARPPSYPNTAPQIPAAAPAGVHPAPIPHCPWSACYDENSGFTYYWNQYTNAVTWEAPPEYLLALKLAQQQLNTSGSTEVSAEEWQLYQQALAEKQSTQTKSPAAKLVKTNTKFDKQTPPLDKNSKFTKKRAMSDDEEEKIELITSYHNSDSESNDESDKSKDVSLKASPAVKKPVKATPPPVKKAKKQVTQYGPTLPPNQNYSIPIGPELPPQLVNNKSPECKVEVTTKNQAVKADDDENQDDDALLKKLKDKAKLLKNLGGELPMELQKIIKEDTKSTTASPKVDDLDIDDLLQEIEKKELPKVKGNAKSVSGNSSPSGVRTPPLEELKALYPNGNFNESASLFPSAANIADKDIKPGTPPPAIPPEKEKKENVYLKDSNEVDRTVTRKKLRISNSVLPAKKVEVPSYTTKYSQYIEGFSTERTGLGFSKDESGTDSPKNTVSYGNGLTFTKGETLNEEKKDESLEDLIDLVEAKLKYLNELQPCQLTQIQEMLIQLNVVASAYRAGALRHSWVRSWAERAGAALARHEAAAAPPGWSARFERSERRYCYRREDGFTQWEYPVGPSDMEICTTPPPPEVENKEPPPPQADISWSRATPPPPGTEPPAQHQPPPPPATSEPKKEIGDELMSFYADIAELEKDEPKDTKDAKDKDKKPETKDKKPEAREKEASRPNTRPASPEPPSPPEIKTDVKAQKKKSKVKISSSLGMKNKSVSSLVAKWQQVAEEINSD